jgi:hypothetical protein
MPIEIPIRYFVRTYCQAQIYALWSSQNRFQNWIQIAELIDWSSTWLYLNNNQKITDYSHSFQSSALKTFRIKTLLNELPTPHTLFKRKLTTTPNCHQCNQQSFSLHWTICPSNSLLFNLIDNSLTTTINSTKLDISATQLSTLHCQIKNLDSMILHSFANKLSLFSTLTGLIPTDIISTLSEITLSQKRASTLTIQFLLHLNQQIYKQLWIPYCTSRHQLQTLPTQSLLTPNITTPLYQPNTIPSTISKLKVWYPEWIKYRTPINNIITNIQI